MCVITHARCWASLTLGAKAMDVRLREKERILIHTWKTCLLTIQSVCYLHSTERSLDLEHSNGALSRLSGRGVKITVPPPDGCLTK